MKKAKATGAKASSKSGPPSRKLIDRLARAKQSELLAVVATSFEFDAEFFETDFLPSLLGLGAWDDRNWTSRIEIEKHLSTTEAVAIFTDVACYRTRPRSLRVGLYPVKIGPGRIQHAKVTLLVYADEVRLLVGSANLTAAGYRKNREVAAMLRVTPTETAQAPLIRQAIDGMLTHLAEHWTAAAEKGTRLALEKLDAWADEEADPDDGRFAWSGVGEQPLWEQVIEQLPAGEQVRAITIVSPFWSEETGDGPIAQFVDALRARGLLAPMAKVRLLAEARPTGDGTLLPVLRESHTRWDARALGIDASAAAVDPAVLPEEVDGLEDFRLPRPLHAKVVVLESAKTTVAYLGSANFTNHGWGFRGGLPANIEAGMIVRATGKDRAQLAALLPATAGADIPLDGAAGDRLALLVGYEPPAPWPAFIRSIQLVTSTGEDTHRLDLEVVVVEDEVEGDWAIAVTDTALARREPGQDTTFRVALDEALLARLLVERQVV
ncbi:MAG: hypothetical protein NT062_11845, partial [Proteobacteria bacterium]|nr:hypothetical protein [Pseudomonadota bacterium]